MMTVWPSEARMRSPSARASASAGPPAANGTISVMGREGRIGAPALAMPSAATSPMMAENSFRISASRSLRDESCCEARRTQPPRARGRLCPRRLFGLQVRCSDDRPPLLGFGPVMHCECLRRLLVTRPHFLADIGKALPYARIGQGVDNRRVELGDDVLRRPLR